MAPKITKIQSIQEASRTLGSVNSNRVIGGESSMRNSLIIPHIKIEKRPQNTAHSKDNNLNQSIINLKMNSPSNQLSVSILNKTTPISPMRDRMLKSGLSRPKERPIASGGGVII